MGGTDGRIELIKRFQEQIRHELAEMETPEKYRSYEKEFLAGRDETYGGQIPISGNEWPAFNNFQVNNHHRLKELENVMGTLLLYFNTGAIVDYLSTVRKGKPEASGYFWQAYGHFLVTSYGLLDSLGGYLAFVFFGHSGRVIIL